MAGEVNDKEEGELKIQATNGLTVKENGEYEKWPVEAGKDSKNVITFADEAGNASFSFPVFFKGMGAEDINITEPELNSRYGWNVSLDGKTFKLAGSMDGGENVITFNDKMELLWCHSKMNMKWCYWMLLITGKLVRKSLKK